MNSNIKHGFLNYNNAANPTIPHAIYHRNSENELQISPTTTTTTTTLASPMPTQMTNFQRKYYLHFLKASSSQNATNSDQQQQQQQQQKYSIGVNNLHNHKDNNNDSDDDNDNHDYCENDTTKNIINQGMIVKKRKRHTFSPNSHHHCHKQKLKRDRHHQFQNGAYSDDDDDDSESSSDDSDDESKNVNNSCDKRCSKRCCYFSQNGQFDHHNHPHYRQKAHSKCNCNVKHLHFWDKNFWKRASNEHPIAIAMLIFVLISLFLTSNDLFDGLLSSFMTQKNLGQYLRNPFGFYFPNQLNIGGGGDNNKNELEFSYKLRLILVKVIIILLIYAYIVTSMKNGQH